MNGREFKDLTFHQFAKIGNAFASPKRLELIDILSQGERNVETLAKETAMNVANTSRHLQILKNANLVVNRKNGVRVVYRLADEEVIKCWENLRSLAEKSTAEVREVARLFFEERNALEPIAEKEFLKRVKQDQVTLIDVRPKEEFNSGHIQGAISIPLKELKKRLKDIPANREVVAYCRGAYCVLAAEAIKILNANGYKAIRLKEDVYIFHSGFRKLSSF